MARKVEEQMIAAIRAGQAWKSGDTEVAQSALGAVVLLHGNKIAEIGGRNGTVWSLAGRNTATTRSRINALARAFNWRGVRTIGGVPFACGSAVAPMGVISATEWVNALA